MLDNQQAICDALKEHTDSLDPSSDKYNKLMEEYDRASFEFKKMVQAKAKGAEFSPGKDSVWCEYLPGDSHKNTNTPSPKAEVKKVTPANGESRQTTITSYSGRVNTPKRALSPEDRELKWSKSPKPNDDSPSANGLLKPDLTQLLSVEQHITSSPAMQKMNELKSVLTFKIIMDQSKPAKKYPYKEKPTKDMPQSKTDGSRNTNSVKDNTSTKMNPEPIL